MLAALSVASPMSVRKLAPTPQKHNKTRPSDHRRMQRECDTEVKQTRPKAPRTFSAPSATLIEPWPRPRRRATLRYSVGVADGDRGSRAVDAATRPEAKPEPDAPCLMQSPPRRRRRPGPRIQRRRQRVLTPPATSGKDSPLVTADAAALITQKLRQTTQAPFCTHPPAPSTHHRSHPVISGGRRSEFPFHQGQRPSWWWPSQRSPK